MSKLRIALLSACAVVLPLAAAVAAQPARAGIVVFDVFGDPIGVLSPLPGGSSAPTAVAAPWNGAQAISSIEARMMPEMRDISAIFAEQDAMMRSVMARMDALASAPSGAFSLPADGATRIVISTYDSAHGSCTRTISYGATPAGAQPQLVSHTVGSGCAADSGMGAAVAPRTVPASEPSATPAPATPEAGGARVYHIDARVPLHRAPHAYSG